MHAWTPTAAGRSRSPTSAPRSSASADPDSARAHVVDGTRGADMSPSVSPRPRKGRWSAKARRNQDPRVGGRVPPPAYEVPANRAFLRCEATRIHSGCPHSTPETSRRGAACACVADIYVCWRVPRGVTSDLGHRRAEAAPARMRRRSHVSPVSSPSTIAASYSWSPNRRTRRQAPLPSRSSSRRRQRSVLPSSLNV
jgi:hypothetical protein